MPETMVIGATADWRTRQGAVGEGPDPGDGRNGEGISGEAAMRGEDGEDLLVVRRGDPW